MKFSVSSKELSRALTTVSKVIIKRNTLPILDNALVSFRDDRFFLTGSSSESTLTIPLDMRSMDKAPFRPFCLPVAMLSPILGTLSEQPVEMTIDDTTFLATFRYQVGDFSVPAYDGADFPLPKEQEHTYVEFSMPTSVFIPAIKAASVCTADDELRPVLNAVALDVSNDGVTFAATSMHMLYKYVYSHGIPFVTKGEPRMILLHKKAISALDSAFSNSEEISLRHDGRKLIIEADGITLMVTDVEGKYPNYNSVIPTQSPYHIVMPVRDLINAVKRVALMANTSTQIVSVRKQDGAVSLRTEDTDFSRKANEALHSDDCTLPDGFAIGLRSTYFLTMLSAISTDNVRLELTAHDRPIIIREDAANSSLVELLMPMRLDA